MIPSSNTPYDPSQDIASSNAYYGQLGKKTQAELNNEIATRNTGYGYQANELQNQLGVATRDLNNTEGEKGTWGSSARDIRLSSLANTYKNQMGNLYNTTQGANTASLIGGEYDLGNMNLPDSSITQYTPNLGNGNYGAGARGASALGSPSVRYNPFGGFGQIEANRTGYNSILSKQKGNLWSPNMRPY